MIRNPVLAGSHPDPSIVRVGPDFYIATSTFEWYPGVRLHRSRDLANWQPLGGILDDQRLLDLSGCPDSGGVWAPNLSYADGLFHLVYSNVSTYAAGFTDCPNYVITAPSADGPWSDPVLLHARGFDASLFHDGDASWLVNMVHDWRPGHGGSAGLEATRYDRAAKHLVGERVRIELPPGGGWIEGPNLYRRGDWYYLVTADGGTGYEHQVTVSRSRTLTGPYERDPAGPLVTAKHRPDWPLQKAGHGSLVETEDGRWFMSYLVARPLGTHGPCILGRETALAEVRWVDDWPVVPGGLPALELPALELPTPYQEAAAGGNPQWSTLRRPATSDWVTLSGDTARIKGGRSPQSLVEPSLVARPVTSLSCSLEAVVDCEPRGFQHAAGITAYYNTRNWHFLYVTLDDRGDRVLRAVSCDRGELTAHEASVAVDGSVQLGLTIDGGDLAFRYATGAGWQPFVGGLDATILSDEHAVEIDDGQVRALGFTGAFVGLWVWDLTGQGNWADFTAVRYADVQAAASPM